MLRRQPTEFDEVRPTAVRFATAPRYDRAGVITQRRTKPQSPTTTGKIERFHKALREEFLDHVAPFESLAAAQQAVDGWTAAYNQQRPHQALDMATPASLFRPNGPTRLDVLTDVDAVPSTDATRSRAASLLVDVIEPAPRRLPKTRSNWKSGCRRVWANPRSLHVSVDGHLVRTVPSRLLPEHLQLLRMCGARPAGPEPGKPARRRTNGTTVLPARAAIEIKRVVNKDGGVGIGGHHHVVGFAWTGRAVTLRLDGHLMHAIADNALIGTWPCPIGRDHLGRLRGARTPITPPPSAPLPPGSLRAQRRVHESGRTLVAGHASSSGPATAASS
ncbi:transposase [Nocardia gamkensis]|uniref:Transposase n=1 Tax=Nocardia gamkensis TaxID=352869 RepID=A0A7X6R777_9NOCA|nr:transposase [Nocardia gamkensis]